ncbi:MAG: hypothetical protein WBG92_01350 [Thiohalocapsa sp.]
MQTANITELRSHLPEYIARAEASEEIMVSRRVRGRRPAGRGPRSSRP